MIRSVSIENLRGIREGKLDGMTSLVVLVGSNGAGKSTILDALLIGAGRRPATSAGYAVERRGGPRHGARWLLFEGGKAPGRITLDLGDGKQTQSALSWSDTNRNMHDLRKLLAERGAEGPYSSICVQKELPVRREFTCVFAADNRYEADDANAPRTEDRAAWIVDPRHGRSLHDLYSRLSEHGRRRALFDLVAPLVPGLRLIEILTEHESARLHLTFEDRSIPVALAGEGIQSLVRLGLELTTHAAGTALLEEPEAHMHPAAIRASAGAIVAGVRAGLQVVLTTHSLELIDGLIEALPDAELAVLSLYRLKLNSGTLLQSRLGGEDVLHARGEIEDDLR